MLTYTRTTVQTTSKPSYMQSTTDNSRLSHSHIARGSPTTGTETRTHMRSSVLLTTKQSAYSSNITKTFTDQPLYKTSDKEGWKHTTTNSTGQSKQSTIDSETGRESTSNSTIQPKIQTTDDRKTGRHTSQQSTIQSYTMLTTNTTSVSPSGKSLNRRKRKQY